MVRERSERSVRRLSDAAERFLLTPREGCCVCRRCFNFTGGYELCYACAAGEQHADVVVPISYSVAHEELHHLLASYKRTSGVVADRAALVITAILWRFLTEHEGCVARAAGARSFDLVTTVPSGDLARDTQHPLRRIVGELSAPTRERHARLLCRTTVDVAPRRFHSRRFEARRRIDGARVLLIDDTWTTGASAQSAAAALKAAGARTVAAVVVGRHVNREWNENDHRLRGLSPRFEWSQCAACVGYGRVGLAAA